MTTAPVLRLATVDDVPVLLDLVRTAFEEYCGWLDPPSGAHGETEVSVRGYLTREAAVIAEVDGRPVACAFFLPQGDHMYMHRLAVDPAHRRHGLGRVISAYIEAEARRLGLPSVRVSVRTVLLGNRFFYESMGYRIVEPRCHPGFDVYTYYVMEKVLDGCASPPQRAMRNIRIVPYDPAWATTYAAEAARLRDAFGDELVEIHHMGSTSIVGCAAKPVIDILPVVRDIERVDRRNPWLVTLGYVPRGENGIPGRRYFSKGSDAQRTHHVHAYQVGHPEIARHLDFCAYLAAHPEEVQRYVALKQQLAARFPHDIYGYNGGKSALIAKIDAKAAAWRAQVPRDFGSIGPQNVQ